MLQIVEVKLQSAQHFFDGVGIAVVERGIRGDARAYLVELLVTAVALHNLADIIGTLRTVAHKRHVAHQHIPQLGQFVQMVFAQKLAHLGQPGVVLGL